MNVLTAQEIKRFWAKVDVRSPEECWTWIPKNGNKYPQFRIWRNGKIIDIGAHMISLVLKLTHDNFVYACHTCDNKRCCNPHHLYGCSVSENTKDSWTRIRRPQE